MITILAFVFNHFAQLWPPPKRWALNSLSLCASVLTALRGVVGSSPASGGVCSALSVLSVGSSAARILRRVSERADGRRVSLLERVFELAHDETVDLFLASPHSVVHNIELLLDCEHLFG